MKTDRVFLIRCRDWYCLFLTPLLALVALASIQACKAGDIGSSSSSSDSQVDNSDDHTTGDTRCTVTVVTQADGDCTYTRDCDGAQVESGDFPAQQNGQCVLPIAVEEPTSGDL